MSRTLDDGFTICVALMTAAVAFVLWLWMARSGNDSALAVSPFEWRLRAALEGWLMARPRNKEIFGAYPAFLLSFWCAAHGRKKAAAVLGLAAVIAPIDVVNSFCQANNPLALSLWRSIWGLVIGGTLGSLAIGLLRLPHASLRPSRAQLRFAVGVLAIAAGYCLIARQREAVYYAALTTPAKNTSWPWPAASREELSPGVTHWFDRSSPDGTTLDLLEFDFARDPHLRFEILDRDADDAHPFDNRVRYWNEGLAPITARATRRGEVVALVNGSFFGLLNHRPREADGAFHLAPVVLNGRVHYAGTNHRWTFGVQYPQYLLSSLPDRINRPFFAADHLPSRSQLEAFDFASGTAQCVVKDGIPLRLAALPHGTVPFEAPSPVASTPAEAGHIRILDWMKTSRVSFGWSQDSSRLWLLFVKEPDGETPSRAAVHGGRPASGGWTLADVQRFWLVRGAATAVVTDGGDVAQLAFRQHQNWLLVPPRFSTPSGPATARYPLTDLKQAPPSAQHGGALMYFVIRRTREAGAASPTPPQRNLQRNP